MGFTTRCLIKKSTPELIDKLRGLGYIIMKSTDGSNYIMTTFGCAVGMKTIYPFQVCTHTSPIDCGTNEELFIALAALRDDTDKFQWFISPEGVWVYNKDYDSILEVSLKWHKASVNELIEHFKGKESQP